MTSTNPATLAQLIPEGQRDKAESWFFGRTDIWGKHRPELRHGDAGSAGLGRRIDAPQGQELAYCLLQQLNSRIATQGLGFRSGDEAAALKSVFRLFEYSRAQVERRGPAAAPVADLIWWMLNRDVRPFTAKWHRVLTREQLGVEDVNRRFRDELNHLRGALRVWSALLRGIATGEPQTFTIPEPRTPRLLLPGPGERRSTPCSVDGLAVPTAFAEAFSRLVARERPCIESWRKVTDRPVEAPLTGIALSGGGIRSATFSLGILRRLASRVDVLAVDYLSTVSGGGYLGGLISSALERQIGDRPGRGPFGSGDGEDLAGAVVGWLRGNSAAMAVDAELFGSIAGGLLGLPGEGAAALYRQRLLDVWVVAAKTERPPTGFPAVIGGGLDLKLSDLEQPAPVHIWNLAINATEQSDRMKVALRGRGADLYTVSRCGSDCRLLGFSEPGEWLLSSAMALSGAASAPTTSETSASWALRIASALGGNLGAWIDHGTGEGKPAPWWDRFKLLAGSARAERGQAFLSDGGHVENTAVYPLLRRRCAFILAIDGEQDGEMSFSGLLELQHLARVELGVTLEVDTTDLELGTNQRSDTHFIAVPITYPRLGPDTPEERGVLIYVKLSLTGDEPRYLNRFKQLHPEFPHHSTIRHQAFDDKTFEAYLALGEHVGAQLISEHWAGVLSESSPFEDWFIGLATNLLD